MPDTQQETCPLCGRAFDEVYGAPLAVRRVRSSHLPAMLHAGQGLVGWSWFHGAGLRAVQPLAGRLGARGRRRAGPRARPVCRGGGRGACLGVQISAECGQKHERRAGPHNPLASCSDIATPWKEPPMSDTGTL